jgi:hypothetical protein
MDISFGENKPRIVDWNIGKLRQFARSIFGCAFKCTQLAIASRSRQRSDSTNWNLRVAGVDPLLFEVRLDNFRRNRIRGGKSVEKIFYFVIPSEARNLSSI